MCGIAGFTHFGGRPEQSEQVLAAMCAAQVHRGPDGQGVFHGKEASLGHCRLAIIDLHTGDQPMANEDASVWVVFNGEIYNYRELRRELEKDGHCFATQSDTEVLVHGYESWGEGLLSRLNGMFAFALYDACHSRLLLARDPLGQKPLHYARTREEVVFASEIKALLAHPCLGRNRELDHLSLAYYLSLEYVPSPRTIFKGIKKLKPGHYLVVAPEGISEHRYWSLPLAAARVEMPADFGEAAEAFWELFRASVKRRLVSDVPLGVFLSGGLDSLAVSLAARQAGKSQLNTFSIGFDEESFDETPHARAAARALGTNHASQVLSLGAAREVLPLVVGSLDEPMADSSILPTFLLSRFTRGHVTVALSGDGGDEFLGGYPTFQAHRLATRMGRPLGAVLFALSPAIDKLLPVSHASLSLDFRVKWFLRGLGKPAGERLLTWLGSFSGRERQNLLTPQALEEAGQSAGLRRELAGSPADFKDLTALSLLYARTYLENDILVKVDRASMQNSLEVRSPFLDPHLVAFMAALPDDFKVRKGLGAKPLLKKALQDQVGPDLLARPKQGFGVPISSWLAGPLGPWMNELLDPGRLRREGLFQPEYVSRLVEEHRSRKRDNRKFLWPLLVFQAWRERFLDRPLVEGNP